MQVGNDAELEQGECRMDGIPDWFIVLFVVSAVYGISKEILERRCPRCGTWFSRETVNEEKFDVQGLIFKNPTKVRYLYKCVGCQHRWEAVKKIDNDPGW